ncbi:MAG: cytochrome c peroxidase, partial [Bacteroidota bacterium]
MKKYLLLLCLCICVLAIAALPYRPSAHRLGITAEQDTPTLPADPFQYEIFANPLPDHFFMDSLIFGSFYDPGFDTVLPTMVFNHVETLGRVLFYDKRLSIDNTVSCASCHLQSVAFADTAALSLGFNGSLGERNSISLSNAFAPSMKHFFWDAGTDTMATQIKLALESAIEMGMNPDSLKARIENTTFYPDLYQNAFGDPTVSVDRSVAAIRSFVLSMISLRSKYDVGRSGKFEAIETFDNFTPLENQGKDIFLGISGNANCASCHQGELFLSSRVSNNGLDLVSHDPGFGGISQQAQDSGLFRAPSLRNIALTAPYMHDGRFATLEEVIEHYSSGVKAHPNLDPLLRDPENDTPLHLNLDATEKQALLAFLHTLTDSAFIRDVRWSNPFDPNNGADTIPLDSFSLPLPIEPILGGSELIA